MPFANMVVSALAFKTSERTVCRSIDTNGFSLPDIRDVDSQRHAGCASWQGKQHKSEVPLPETVETKGHQVSG